MPKPLELIAVFLSLVVAFSEVAGADPVDKPKAVPQTLDQLWADFDALDKTTPLDVETLKSWEQDGVDCRIVKYQVGIFKGAPARVAALFAVPKADSKLAGTVSDGKKLPAVLELHGGGQSASLSSVTTYARRGYAAMSLNWGGNPMTIGAEKWDGPQTDWGKLDATHPPQRNKANHFAGPLTPDEYTLDDVESPRNSNWYVVLLAARRAITFLQRQPEIDPARIGVFGHSMGGKLTTNLAGIDRRVVAAVPSCGGSGDLLNTDVDVPGGSRSKRSPLELACVSDNAYIPRIQCPILWLSPTNDFHAHIDNMAWNWRNMPDQQVRFSISPHFNHHHHPAHAITEYLWFEQHLKGASFQMPKTPRITIDLKSQDGIPAVVVVPDNSLPVQRVDIYYSTDPHALTRFWRDAGARESNGWRASCPIMSVDEPLFVYANVIYSTPTQYRAVAQRAGQENTDEFALSSRVQLISDKRLKAEHIKATDKLERMIDDGTRGWNDWYRLNWGHPPLWTATTRKLKDPKWRGPDGASLRFQVRCLTDNQLVLTFGCNAWGAISPGKPATEYSVVKKLKGSSEWQDVSVELQELTATDPKISTPLENWRSVTEFSISPSGMIAKDGAKTRVTGNAWQGSREIRALRWEGGAP